MAYFNSHYDKPLYNESIPTMVFYFTLIDLLIH